MTVVDIVILVAVLALIGVLYAIVQAERKRGAPLCGRACGGCPHPCRSDGTPMEQIPTVSRQTEVSKSAPLSGEQEVEDTTKP